MDLIPFAVSLLFVLLDSWMEASNEPEGHSNTTETIASISPPHILPPITNLMGQKRGHWDGQFDLIVMCPFGGPVRKYSTTTRSRFNVAITIKEINLVAIKSMEYLINIYANPTM